MSSKESIRKFAKKTFKEMVYPLLEDWEFLSKTPSEFQRGSCVFRRAINKDLSIFILLMIHNSYNNFFFEFGWSRGDYPDCEVDLISFPKQGFIETFRKKFSPDFEEEKCLFKLYQMQRLDSLETGEERDRGMKFPMVVNNFHYERVCPRVRDMIQRKVDLLQPCVLPYLDLCVNHKLNTST